MPIVASIVEWLRAGYPDGVPEVDYVPLFALLGSKLTDDQVQALADALARDGEPNTAEHIHAAATAVTQGQPLDVDIARVRARLAAGGWPLADFRSPLPD
jgi:sirohydrochlorin ferrochelatase